MFQSVGVITAIVYFFWERKQRKKAQGYESYLRSIEQYLDLEKLMIESPELRSAYAEMSDYYKSLSDEDRINYHLLSMVLTIGEIIYYCNRKKWLEKTDADGWESWMLDWKKLGKFGDIFKDMEEQFGSEFIKYIEKLEEERELLKKENEGRVKKAKEKAREEIEKAQKKADKRIERAEKEARKKKDTM